MKNFGMTKRRVMRADSSRDLLPCALNNDRMIRNLQTRIRRAQEHIGSRKDFNLFSPEPNFSYLQRYQHRLLASPSPGAYAVDALYMTQFRPRYLTCPPVAVATAAPVATPALPQTRLQMSRTPATLQNQLCLPSNDRFMCMQNDIYTNVPKPDQSVCDSTQCEPLPATTPQPRQPLLQQEPPTPKNPQPTSMQPNVPHLSPGAAIWPQDCVLNEKDRTGVRLIKPNPSIFSNANIKRYFTRGEYDWKFPKRHTFTVDLNHDFAKAIFGKNDRRVESMANKFVCIFKVQCPEEGARDRKVRIMIMAPSDTKLREVQSYLKQNFRNINASSYA